MNRVLSVTSSSGAAPEPAPSDWLLRWAPLLPAAARVLDVACGHGRHVRHLARAGHQVTAVDREPSVLAPLGAFAQTVLADLEAAPWPLPGAHFDLVLVTNYLWRPLFPALLAAVKPNGLLIYETFTEGQALIGRPRRPEFLLRPGELLQLVQSRRDASSPWHVIAFEEGRLAARDGVAPREVQRVVARLGPPRSDAPDLLVPPG